MNKISDQKSVWIIKFLTYFFVYVKGLAPGEAAEKVIRFVHAIGASRTIAEDM